MSSVKISELSIFIVERLGWHFFSTYGTIKVLYFWVSSSKLLFLRNLSISFKFSNDWPKLIHLKILCLTFDYVPFTSMLLICSFSLLLNLCRYFSIYRTDLLILCILSFVSLFTFSWTYVFIFIIYFFMLVFFYCSFPNFLNWTHSSLIFNLPSCLK